MLILFQPANTDPCPEVDQGKSRMYHASSRTQVSQPSHCTTSPFQILPRIPVTVHRGIKAQELSCDNRAPEILETQSREEKGTRVSLLNFSPDLISLALRFVTCPSQYMIISNLICTAAAQSAGVLRAGDHRHTGLQGKCLRCARFALVLRTGLRHLILISWRH